MKHWSWWSPPPVRSAGAVYDKAGNLVKDLGVLTADEVYCDVCNAPILVRPVPSTGDYALCPPCFGRLFGASVAAAARQDKVKVTAPTLGPWSAIGAHVLAIVDVAARGTGGVNRPVSDLLGRLKEERAELLEAQTPEHRLEEAGDGYYYLALAFFNGLWEDVYLENLRILLADADRVLQGNSPLEKRRFLVHAALTKFGVRFLVNSRKKDHQAEHQARRELLQTGKIPASVKQALVTAEIAVP